MLKPLDWKEFRASEWSAHALAGAIAYHIRKMRDGRFAITIAGMHYPAVPTLEKAQAYCQEDLLLRIKHMSPFEHQACSARDEGVALCLWGNFTGWDQHRKMIEAE